MKEYDNIKPMHNSLHLAMSFLLYILFKHCLSQRSGICECWNVEEDFRSLSCSLSHKYNTSAHNAMHFSENSPHAKCSANWLLANQLPNKTTSKNVIEFNWNLMKYHQKVQKLDTCIYYNRKKQIKSKAELSILISITWFFRNHSMLRWSSRDISYYCHDHQPMTFYRGHSILYLAIHSGLQFP